MLVQGIAEPQRSIPDAHVCNDLLNDPAERLSANERPEDALPYNGVRSQDQERLWPRVWPGL